MVSFVESSLAPDERIIRVAKLHWALFLVSGIILFFGILSSLQAPNGGSVFLLVVGGIFLIKALLTWRTTELALTNKRVISKWGIIRRRNIDTNLNKIEGVSFHQGIIGRFLGYGSVVIRGTGGDHQPVPFIRAPEEFKKAVNTALDTVAGSQNVRTA
jgi:uncharacterized membrane protein YdbT with pleckstrin-like domain